MTMEPIMARQIFSGSPKSEVGERNSECSFRSGSALPSQ